MSSTLNAMDATPLTAVERTALALCTYINTNPSAKALQTAFHRQFGRWWIQGAIGHRLRMSGLEHAVGLRPDRGVLLCANHRSFFDQYVLMSVLYQRAEWPRRCYFPVRANFFYEEWSGIVVNGFIGGFAMWPPIFRQRDSAHAELNKRALEEISVFIAEPGTIVGMHPEGTRGKGPDPYELLAAQPGVGQVVMRSRPIVLPVFINGLGNDLLSELTSRWDARSAEERPINCVFGAPVDFGELLDGKPRPAQYKRVADRILDAIRGLGEIERGLRAGPRAPTP
jgi:1-acyl-sn-glycerol-3-phosphate acyltransferase